jgi:hypothetical protein
MQLKIRILTNILYFVFCIENEWRKKIKREKKITILSPILLDFMFY